MQLAKSLLKKEMTETKNLVKAYLKSEVFLLDMVMNYIVKQKGKMMRPYFVFLVAQLFGKINESTIRAAAAIEILHTATLIHDDVVDSSDKRRGVFSVSYIWKNKIAVLSGDYLLSKGLLLLLEHKDFDILNLMSEATKQMSKGELLQIQKRRMLSVTEEDYFRIIEGKTASLFAASCAAGAYSVLQSNEQEQLMQQLGTAIGTAFQIKDDLLDFTSSTTTGKPKGQDIKNKKLTLPLLHVYHKSSFFQKRQLKQWIQKAQKDSKYIDMIRDVCESQGGREYAHNVMKINTNKAISILQNFPESKTREAFVDLINFVVNREK